MEVVSAAMDDEKCLIVRRFEAAVNVIQSMPPDGPFQPSNNMMLKFYSFYKQATIGPCNVPRPRFWDIVGKFKWDAWHSLGDMSKEAAMTGYVDEMKVILEGMPVTEEVEALLQVLGPFYELVEEKRKITQISDLSTGFGSTLNSMSSSMPSRSVAKSIVRTMEMNGTLRAKEVKETSEEEEDDDEEEEEEEEDVEIREDREGLTDFTSAPKSRRRTVPNGDVVNGGVHLTNGNHSKAALNGDHAPDASPSDALLNGHRADASEDSPGSKHVASDSDSDVYCDSVDQFGQEEEESPDLNRSLDELDDDDEEEEEEEEEEEDAHVLQEATEQEGLQGPPQVVRFGGEDGDGDGTLSQRRRTDGDVLESSVVRGGEDSGSQAPGPVVPAVPAPPRHGGGYGVQGRGGGAVVSLNEQIVAALARLQEDMQSVLERLQTLEALSATQARSLALSPTYTPAPPNKRNQKPSWWPFDISPASLAFAVTWPFVVQWLIRLFLRRRRRRLN